jgi:hypothetical protein
MIYGILAQLVEHLTFNQGVPGSNPGCLIFTEKHFADMAELADALDLGSSPRGCRFNSCYPQYKALSDFWKLRNKHGSQNGSQGYIYIYLWLLLWCARRRTFLTGASPESAR